MHSDIRIAKEAIQQLEKANSWVRPALRVEGADQEIVDSWAETYANVNDFLRDFIEDAK